ncbi:MAG: hypothetical protein QMD22_00060 [archaeon]|nr:hypothetical protein [archaeon]
MNLRYYSSERWDFELKDLFYVMNLLNKVNERVCPVEVILDKSEEEIWKNDMLPQTRVIKKNTGKTAAEWLKSGSGNLYVYGTLAVVENGAVQWITKYEGVKETLEDILENPEKGIENLLDEIKEKPKDENAVLNNFIQSGLIRGQSKREVEVGIKHLEERYKERGWNEKDYNSAKNLVAKKIDLVIENEDEIWLIEGKSEFESKKAEEALGQILLYEELYHIDHNPEKTIRKAVVFGESSNPHLFESLGEISLVEKAFKRHEIKVFIEGRDF